MPQKKHQKYIPKKPNRYSINQKRKRQRFLLLFTVVVIVLLSAGAWAYFRFRTFDKIKVSSSLELANPDEQTTIVPHYRGYMRFSCEGVTYFDSKGVIWAESFEMTQPITSSCGAYFAAADMKGKDVYLYDASGLCKRITMGHTVTDIEVSSQGVVAAATSEGDSNYIEVVDRDGNELVTAKSVFASSGYLTDIALSEDGSKLVAVYVYVSEGSLESKAVFYDFSGQKGGEDMVVGGFNQYQGTILTTAKFMAGGKVCVVGDNIFIIYDFNGTPSIAAEVSMPDMEIQNLFFDDKHIGFILEDAMSEHSYVLKVCNLRGKEILNRGFDFTFNKAAFTGSGVAIYSATDIELFSFAGIQKCSITTDERIVTISSCGNERDFVLGTVVDTEFIRLK